MHWILTEPREPGARDLLALLERTGTPHDVVRGGTKPGSIVPDVRPSGPVICLGSHSLARVSRERGWSPGAPDASALGYPEAIAAWGPLTLNADAVFCRLDGLVRAIDALGLPRAFVRPAYDTKAFDARVVDASGAAAWLAGLGPSPSPDTAAMCCAPKEILAEWRTWVVGGRVATSSLYRRGGRPLFDGSDRPEGMLALASRAAAELSGAWGEAAPAAYVLDVALVPDGYRIVEVNGIAGARLYGCDVGRLFEALSGLSGPAA